MNREELKRASYIHFRVGEAERQALLRLCSLEQAGISETMRLVLRQAAKERGVWLIQAQESQAVRHA